MFFHPFAVAVISGRVEKLVVNANERGKNGGGLKTELKQFRFLNVLYLQ